jgi:MFS transporter, DHA2 family, multidrug resistance protein
VLYANTTTLPALLQTLFGYDATTSGLVLSPAGAFSVGMLFIVGALLTRGMDARYLIATGLLTMAVGNYWMSQLNLEVGPWSIVWPRVVIIVGLSMVFAPLNVAAFLFIPKELRGAAVGLLALLRNEGGSVGTSLGKIILDRREQFRTLRLNESLDPLNPALKPFLDQGRAYFTQQNGDPATAGQMTWGVVEGVRNQQALSLAYFDVFFVSAMAAALLVFLVFLMRRSVAKKGEHIAAE